MFLHSECRIVFHLKRTQSYRYYNVNNINNNQHEKNLFLQPLFVRLKRGRISRNLLYFFALAMAIFNPIWYEKSQSVQIFDQQNQLIDLSTENLKEFKRNSWSPFDFSQSVLDSHTTRDIDFWKKKREKKRTRFQ